MNTQHLQYIIEIERTRSISQAAENLFIGQPNLSRILHDVEQMLGFRIFERSTRGVRPTTRGTIFLQHAKSILRETEAIEALGPKRAVANRLRVCIPRSAAMLDLTAQYLAGLPQAEPVDAVIRECHARIALETLASGETEIGVIRFRSEYRDYFDEQTSARGLSFELLSKYHYLVTLNQSHPLAGRKSVMRAELDGLPEIVHGDMFRVQGKPEELVRRKIYCVDRLAQMTLLEKIPNSYMLAPAIPEHCIQRWNLVQLPCSDNQSLYLNALVYHKQYAMSEFTVDVFVGNHRNQAVGERKLEHLSDKVLVALVFGVNGNGLVTEKRFRTGRCNDDAFSAVSGRIADLPKVARSFLAFDFKVAHRTLQLRIPVHEALAAVDETFTVKLNEGLFDDFA